MFPGATLRAATPVPEYTYVCPRHGEFMKYHRMATVPSNDTCPRCGASSQKILSDSRSFMPATDWSCENGGKGREMVGLRKDPGAPKVYAKSPEDGIEMAKRRGLKVETP